MRNFIPFSLISVALGLASCVDAPTGDTPQLFPTSLELASAPGMDNRIDYEVTGPTWETPHRHITERVFATPLRPLLLPDGSFETSLNEPAPYVQGTPMLLRAEIGAAFTEEHDLEIAWSVEGTLRSTTDETIDPIRFFSENGVVERRDGVNPVITIATDDLPTRVDVWELDLAWKLESTLDGEPFFTAGKTKHTIPLLLQAPTEDAPRYKQAILWSSQWAAGEWDLDDPETKHQIAEKLTYGVRSLENLGRSYGSFPRPKRSLIEDRVDIYLDFERSACGEHRGILMALIEYQGFEASWIWFRFPEPDDAYYDPAGNNRYRTREITAVGRAPQRWSYSNHIIVQVDGRVYDPTHTIVKDSWQEYEDFMFAEYCRKDGESMDCVPNPPGFDDKDGIHPRIVFADNYK